jgi:hypothetical protein
LLVLGVDQHGQGVGVVAGNGEVIPTRSADQTRRQSSKPKATVASAKERKSSRRRKGEEPEDRRRKMPKIKALARCVALLCPISGTVTTQFVRDPVRLNIVNY